jgi:hypothetical protein
VSVLAGSYHGPAGVAGMAGSTATFTVDTVTPTVSLSIDNTDMNVANDTGTVTFAFSEAPVAFALADTSAVGGTLSNLQQTDAPHYTATFTGAASTNISNASVSVTAGSSQDYNGNAGADGSTSAFTVDTVAAPVPTYTYTTFDDPFATLGSFAEGINKGDQIVGFYGGYQAFLYTDNAYTFCHHLRVRCRRHQ